ncbi:EF-P 5-aminopentanol modification-associated protein YfmH [Alkaliphilus peptidifermentans]|uniref:Predicted Zn-dependent peptidase n=1 Tax=Alkaliphilus peptidifermentans DSM 18978 TaxID=1120976 RepID=A0A1G5BGA0_9FIRM|nr:pitrilysin family protein [Alkaliphilus peptidifermentans]SCX89098.1 Predicted Zn-dependent peptidase [Alkaliphilus peptidifermentans DSM 18978]
MTYSEIKGDVVKESIFTKKLSNGLEVFFMPKEGYTKQYAIFATKFGSNDLKFKKLHDKDIAEVPEGIAHFLEHKLFEEPEGNAFDRFAPLGANVNAYTNFNITAYYFTSTDYFYENLKNLIEFVQAPYFTDENVEKEKGIITQEIKMYQDNPQWRVFFNFLKGMYHNHPVRIDIAGTVESINKTTKEDLYTCFNTFYDPSNMILLVAGDLIKEEVFNKVEELFQKQDIKEPFSIIRYYPDEPIHVNKEIIEEKLSVSMPMFYLGYKKIPKNSEERHINLLKEEATVRILLDMVFDKGTDLYQKLYNEGLIDRSFQVDYVCEPDYGHSIISGDSKDPKMVKKIIDEWLVILKNRGLDEADFARVQRKQIGENISYYNSMEYIGNSFIGYRFKNLNFLEYIDMLKSVSFEDVEEELKNHFNEERQVLSIISPVN